MALICCSLHYGFDLIIQLTGFRWEVVPHPIEKLLHSWEVVAHSTVLHQIAHTGHGPLI